MEDGEGRGGFGGLGSRFWGMSIGGCCCWMRMMRRRIVSMRVVFWLGCWLRGGIKGRGRRGMGGWRWRGWFVVGRVMVLIVDIMVEVKGENMGLLVYFLL